MVFDRSVEHDCKHFAMESCSLSHLVLLLTLKKVQCTSSIVFRNIYRNNASCHPLYQNESFLQRWQYRKDYPRYSVNFFWGHFTTRTTAQTAAHIQPKCERLPLRPILTLHWKEHPIFIQTMARDTSHAHPVTFFQGVRSSQRFSHNNRIIWTTVWFPGYWYQRLRNSLHES